MTKSEFYDSIGDIADLVEFCQCYGCSYIVDELKHVDNFDDWVWDELEGLRRRWFWNDLRDALNDLVEPMSLYFKPIGDMEYTEIYDSDLDEYIDEVLSWGDREGFWDPETDDEDGEEEDDEGVDDDVFEVASGNDLAQFIGVR